MGKEYKDQFKQDGYLWGFRSGDVLPTRIKALWAEKLWKQILIIGFAIALLISLGVVLIGLKIIIPSNELILTQKYNLESSKIEQVYLGYHEPFLLSGTAILWCNNSLKTFPSLGTVIVRNTQLDSADNLDDVGNNIMICR